MLRFEQRVVDIICKVQMALEQGSLTLTDFPLDDIMNMIDTTLGEGMWRGLGSRPQEAFLLLVQEYRRGLLSSIEKGDIGQCVQILKLLECQYRCFYTALSREEQLHREETLRKLVLHMGDVYAATQCRALIHRQDNWIGEKNMMQEGKGVVYTCLMKNERQLPLPEYRNVFWDYICFTDRKEIAGKKVGVWEFRLLEEEDLQHTAEAYYRYKVKPYEVLQDYDYSIWVDPQVQIVGPLEQFYEIYGRNATFLGFPAYDKDDIYELLGMSMTEDDENIKLRWKILQYQKEGFPKHFGLINTNLMLRDHRDEEMRKVMQTWWKEMHECKAMIDDGFSYAAWKNNFRYALCDLFAENNAYIKNGDIDLELDLEKME